MNTITLPDGRLKHTTGNWIGIQNADEPITKTKWRRTDIEYYDVNGYTQMRNSIGKGKMDPRYNQELKEEAEAKLKPILGKINIVKAMAESKDDYSIEFITDVEKYVRKNYRITKKQMEALNKVYKRVSENLFEGDKDETK